MPKVSTCAHKRNKEIYFESHNQFNTIQQLLLNKPGYQTNCNMVGSASQNHLLLFSTNFVI